MAGTLHERMSTLDVVFWSVLAGGLTLRWRGIWSRPPPGAPPDRDGFVLGFVFIRGMPLTVVLCWLIFLAAADLSIGSIVRMPTWSLVGLAIAVASCVALQVSIYLFNQPAWLVPPYLRGQRGRLIQRWVKRRPKPQR